MRKLAWIAGGVVAIVIAMVAIALRPVKDDFAALKPYFAQDETKYFSAAEMKRNWAALGGGMPPINPPQHDVSVRAIHLRSIPGRKALDIVKKVAEDNQLSISEPPWAGMELVYTPDGTFDPETALQFHAVEVGQPEFGTPIKISALSEKLIDAWIYDSRPLSFWDGLRVRSKNKGRVPFTKSIGE